MIVGKEHGLFYGAVMVQLAPSPVDLGQPARGTDAQVNGRIARIAGSLLAPDVQVPIASALAGEVMERNLDAGGAFEVPGVSFAEYAGFRRPDCPYWERLPTPN